MESYFEAGKRGDDSLVSLKRWLWGRGHVRRSLHLHAIMTTTCSCATRCVKPPLLIIGSSHTSGDKHIHHIPHSGNTARGSRGPGPQCGRSPPGPVPAWLAQSTHSSVEQTSCEGENQEQQRWDADKWQVLRLSVSDTGWNGCRLREAELWPTGVIILERIWLLLSTLRTKSGNHWTNWSNTFSSSHKSKYRIYYSGEILRKKKLKQRKKAELHYFLGLNMWKLRHWGGNQRLNLLFSEIFNVNRTFEEQLQ